MSGSREPGSTRVFRPARRSDLHRILEIDAEAYSAAGPSATATPEMMAQRLEKSGNWFIVAEIDAVVWGYVSLQPTASRPEDFVSWQTSTDNGTLSSTFCPSGEYVYGVALTVSPRAPRGIGIADALMVQAGVKAISEGKRGLYLSGRMPKYHRFKDKMTPEQYYEATVERRGAQVALDPEIRMYESFGLKRVKLVREGFPGDAESEGYGVVFFAANPCYGWPFPRLWARMFGAFASSDRFMKYFMGK